ncbi:MAG TPA: AAA family ATPase [Puia sp.]|nr:AAA family ATPase [Puia sp.]
MDNLYNRKVINANDVFDDYYLNAKTLYLQYFNILPSLCYVGQIDGEKAFAVIEAKYAEQIVQVHRYQYYDNDGKQYRFDTTMAVLNNLCLIEFNNSSCEILHNGGQDEFITEVTALMIPLKEKQRKKPLEINMVVHGRNKLELKAMEIKRTKLDLDLFYADDFKATDASIRKRLNKKNDKGIVLLHGLPGAGKTTYLRYLIGKIKKRVLFLSPSVATNLMDPNFISLLIDNPNAVLVIEDAENIIMDRKYSPGSAVSNLLNISDGLLADFMNVQVICTFNNSLTLVDQALMRKGRLIAKYEFGKLSVSKSQRLSHYFGFDSAINRPMTIAEIANQHEKEQASTQIGTIGFRRVVMPDETP